MLVYAPRNMVIFWLSKRKYSNGFVQYDDEHILEVAKISGVDEFVRQNPLVMIFN